MPIVPTSRMDAVGRSKQLVIFVEFAVLTARYCQPNRSLLSAESREGFQAGIGGNCRKIANSEIFETAASGEPCPRRPSGRSWSRPDRTRPEPNPQRQRRLPQPGNLLSICFSCATLLFSTYGRKGRPAPSPQGSNPHAEGAITFNHEAGKGARIGLVPGIWDLERRQAEGGDADRGPSHRCTAPAVGYGDR